MTYALPIAALTLTLAAFFLLAQGRFLPFGRPETLLRLLAAAPLLLSGIVLHFFRTALTAAIIPPAFPHPQALVLLTGLFEIAGAIGLLLPRTRRAAALALAVFLIAIFPANIYAAGKVISGIQMPGIPVRTIMQAIYLLLVLIAGFGLPTPGKRRTP